MSYTDYLASRGYHRVTVERTEKLPGDLVLNRVDQPAEHTPQPAKVLPMKRRGGL